MEADIKDRMEDEYLELEPLVDKNRRNLEPVRGTPRPGICSELIKTWRIPGGRSRKALLSQLPGRPCIFQDNPRSARMPPGSSFILATNTVFAVSCKAGVRSTEAFMR